MAYPRFVHHPRLKLTSLPNSTGTTQQPQTASKETEYTTIAAERLINQLKLWTKKAPPAHPIRVLDYSGNRAALAIQAIELGKQTGIEMQFFVVTDSAVAAGLFDEQLADHPNITVLTETLQSLSAIGKPDSYDCVHTSLTLASRRELPLLTTLGKLQRLARAGFIWTDRVDQPMPMKKKRATSITARVDLEFCSYKKPLRSQLFTAAGLRGGTSIS